MNNEILDDFTNKRIYIYCDKSIYKFMEDYIISINKILKATIINKIDKNDNLMNKDNIIIFMQKIPNLGKKIDNTNNNILILNTEQLTRKEWLNYIKKISKDFIIIDYSKENIDIMNKHNIKNTIYFPYIYNSQEIYNLKKTKNLCGIALYNMKRRQNIMKHYSFKNIKINNIRGWKGTRDKILFQHKILINISADKDYNIFETIRCYRCLFNKMIIISEKKYKNELIDYAKHILFAKITDIPKLVKRVLSNYDYYYKKLDIDNVNYTLNNHLINKKKLIMYCRNMNK